MQPLSGALERPPKKVSILTQPEDRVQREGGGRHDRSAAGFNPHPARRPGATGGRLRMMQTGEDVSILTQPEDRVQRLGRLISITVSHKFQSSPSPKTGCNPGMCTFPTKMNLFQSSPSPKTGCNGEMGYITIHRNTFQSSPSPKTGCNPIH